MAVTKAICNKGFSGNSSILPRSNFGVNGQESSPQSLPAYSLNRYGQVLRTTLRQMQIFIVIDF
jgi:NADH:ubiquinone oxidoreductase subunit B-like Fe-S oxidoreductase